MSKLLLFRPAKRQFKDNLRTPGVMGHTQRRNSNTCQEPGPTEMSVEMRSTNICQKPFILSCPLFSFVFSFLSLSSLSVSVSVCGVVCAVWCGTLKNPVCRFKTPRCVHSKTSPCMPAPRAHVETHVRVVRVHTGTF